MAAAYVVSLSGAGTARHLQNGVDMVVVHANDATDAKAMAKAAMGADANDLWDDADVTAIVAASNFIGYRFVIKEYTEAGVLARSCDVTAAGAAQDTIDEIGAVLATALGGGAAYTSGTQVLLLSAAGSGDHVLVVEVFPPAATGQDAPIPGFVASKVDGGAAGDALSVTFCADAFSLPALYARGTLRN